ncbi:C40 family peptidase [Jeotgalibacillus proteolyticus]|uniref:C40 family peptidase n=1 Tax=Jeotgalibacillus proteolyticus TaxID=2082395 RepID=UPI001FD65FF9|nr:C40 family peptidase [Jeotgalibacillus proteolyticus]
MSISAAQVNVTVATLWTEPASVRAVDQKAIQHPVNAKGWISGLTAEDKKALLDENRVQSQLLYGETVYITDEQQGFAKVVIPSQASKKDSRGYPGWIPAVQLTKAENEDIEELHQLPIARVKEKSVMLFDKKGQEIIPLSFNTLLPISQEHDHFWEVITPHGAAFLKKEAVTTYPSIQAIPTKNGQSIVREAERFTGLEYLWGGMSSYGYDCSGFSYTMLRANGYIIPRDASDQAKSGLHIEKENVQPGDLLFFAYEEGKGTLHHVGIYYGDGKMIHSPTPGKKIEIQTIQGSFYEKEWCETRRYWKE